MKYYFTILKKHMAGIFKCAAEAVVEKDGLVLIIQRSLTNDHAPGKWETITGRVEQGESFEDAAIREVKEETGIDVEVVSPCNTFHFYRGAEKDEHLGVSFWCKYISGEVSIDKDELNDYKWVTIDEALQLVEDEGVRRSIKARPGTISV